MELSESNIIFLKKFGARLRKLRKSKGLTQEQLSEKCGLSVKQLGRMERGAVNTGIITIRQFSECLELPFKAFFAL